MLGHSDLLTSTVDKAGSQPHLASLHTPCTGYQYINNLSFKIAVLVWECVHNVPHCQIPSPVKTEWRLISATLWGWRRCFVADQLWFVTRIQEEEVCPRCCPWCLLHNYTLHPLDVSSCSFVDIRANIETVSGPCNTCMCFWYARAPAVRNTSRGGAEWRISYRRRESVWARDRFYFYC